MQMKTVGAALVLSVLLAACGGGGGDAGQSPFGGGSGGATPGGVSPGSGNVSTNESGSVVLSLSTQTISASLPGTVTAMVRDADGNPVPNVLVSFGLTGADASKGRLSVTTSITDAGGQASTTLSPAPGASSGAAYVTASAEVGTTTLTTRTPFTVSATTLSLDPLSLTPASINGYASAAIGLTVAGASGTSPVTVTLTSSCAAAGKAEISPASLTMTSPTASVTYKDKGCGTTDRINAQIAGSSSQQSADLVVAAPATTGIEFVSVDKPTICLAGTGCPSSALVTFKVVDVAGVGRSGVPVAFSLDAGSASAAGLSATSGTTGADGTVAVSVSSRQTPIPVRVKALVTGTTFETVSNQLSITGGLPKAGNSSATNGLSFSATKYALNNNIDGDEATMTLRLNDRFNAPVQDGTAVTIVAAGGTVVPQSCMTKDGACSVKLLVTNPRPLNGRVQVAAYAKAQEYFVDTNNNGEQDGVELYDDVPSAVCLDKNENGSCDTASGEFIVGEFATPDAGNAAWDNGTAFAREQRLFFFSSTTSSPRLFAYDTVTEKCTNTALPLNDPATTAYFTIAMGNTQAIQTKEFCVRDGNTAADALGGNPLMSGSTVAASTTAENVTMGVDNSPVPALVDGPTRHLITVTNTTKPLAAITGGKADLTISMGDKKVTFINLITIAP